MNPEPTGNALVTGAARRIGRAIAMALARDGWIVGIHYRHSTDDARNLEDEILRNRRRAYLVCADLTEDGACEQMFADAEEAGGPVTCLVNNASVFERDTLQSVTRASWDRHLDTNLWAPLILSRLMARALPSGATGNIVNIVDQRAVNMGPGFISYSLSKAGLWALTQNLALTLAPQIRVNAVGPGPTLPSPRQTETQFRRQATHMPLKRGATPEEIGDCVRYIVGAAGMTGQMITLDGGQHLGWDFPVPGAREIEE